MHSTRPVDDRLCLAMIQKMGSANGRPTVALPKTHDSLAFPYIGRGILPDSIGSDSEREGSLFSDHKPPSHEPESLDSVHKPKHTSFVHAFAQEIGNVPLLQERPL